MAISVAVRKWVGRASHAQLDQLEDIIALRRAELDEPPEPPGGKREVISKKKVGKMTVQLERVRCGKNCKGCPHGPYLYGYYWKDGRLVSVYLGKPDDGE